MADDPKSSLRRGGRRVLEYGTNAGRAAFPWWVFIGPVSLICLWLRVFGLFPYPQGGRTWHRHEETMLAWAFFTIFMSFLAMGIEQRRLKERFRMPGWAIAVFFLGFIWNASTFVFLIFAVAGAHPR